MDGAHARHRNPCLPRLEPGALAEHGLQMRTSDYSRLIGRNMADARLILLDAYLGPTTPGRCPNRRAVSILQRRSGGARRSVRARPHGVARRARRAGHSARDGDLNRARTRHCIAGMRGLAGRFHAIVCGDYITRGKPAPRSSWSPRGVLTRPPHSLFVLEDSATGRAGRACCGAHEGRSRSRSRAGCPRRARVGLAHRRQSRRRDPVAFAVLSIPASTSILAPGVRRGGTINADFVWA